MSDKSSHSHSDGKFDFNVSSGAILNLFSRDYQYLRFPGAEQVNTQFERLRQEMAAHSQAFKPPPKNSPQFKSFLEARRDPVVFGDVLVSEDGGFKWRLYLFSLQGDLLRIKRPRVLFKHSFIYNCMRKSSICVPTACSLHFPGSRLQSAFLSSVLLP